MRYFVIKYDSYDSLATSFNEQQIVLPLSRISLSKEETLTFIASVGGTKKYQGYGHVTNVSTSDSSREKYHIVWDKRYPPSSPCTGDDLSGRAMGVNFEQTQKLFNSLDGGKSVNQSRNFQELDEITGRTLCGLISADCDTEWQKDEEIKAKSAVKPFYQSTTSNWTDFIQKVKEGMGTVLFAGQVGSQCYNLNIPGSDIDMIVIAVAPTEDVLGLTLPPPTIKNPPSFQPDYTIHEVSHFLDLLVHGDTRMIEQLFQDTSQTVLQHPFWDQIRSLRKKFLTTIAVQKYMDETFGRKGLLQVEAMWKEMESKNKLNDADSITKLMKKMYIMFRLLGNAKQILEKCDLQLFLDVESPERQFLLDIRKGQFEFNYLRDLALKTKLQMEENLKSKSHNLEENISLETLDFCSEWLLRIRYECFKKAPQMQMDQITFRDNNSVKLLFVAAYEPFSKPLTYVSIFLVQTSLLLLSCLRTIDMAKMEAFAQNHLEKMELDKKGVNTTSWSMWELGKFCELSASNSLKTAELLCTPKEFVVFALPDWERYTSELWNSGTLLSIRLSRKCVEVAKKVVSGSEIESESAKYQLWRLASIVRAHLKIKDINIPLTADLTEFMQIPEYSRYASNLVTEMEKGLKKMDSKDDVPKTQKEKELSSFLLSFRTSFC